MAFAIEDYIDEEFDTYQALIGKLSASTPLVDFRDIQDERQLIEALVTQNKAYAEKILDLFEELAKFIESESATQAMKETQSTSKAHDDFTQNSNAHSRVTANQEEAKSEPDSNELSYLQNKIEYLNSLFMETKQGNEEKEALIKDLEAKNQTITEQLEALTKDKERADKDLEDLMDEFVIVKEKLEAGNSSLKDKDRQLSELKKKAPAGKETPRKVEHERIPESNEEIEELKEKLEHKEKVITDLRAHVDSLSIENTREEDLAPLQTKLSDLGIKLRELKSIMKNLSVKSDIRVEESGRPTASSESGKARREKSETENLSNLIDNDHLVVCDNIRRIAIELLNQSPKKVIVSRADNERAETNFTAQFVERLLRVKEDLEEQLRNAMIRLAQANDDELVARFEEEIQKNQDLRAKNEKLSYSLQKVLLAVQEDLERLSLIHEYARKATSTEDLRNQILASKKKVNDMLHPDVLENLSLSEEYEEQRRLWQEKIAQQAAQYKEDLTILRDELENQKEITAEQERELTGQINAIKEDYEENQRVHAQEVERHVERIEYLEQEKDSLDKYVAELKKIKAELQSVVSEREDTILEYTNKVSEWQAKCGFIENDLRKTLNEKNRLQDIVYEREREIEHLREEQSNLQNKLRRLTESCENLEKAHRATEQELIQKNNRIQDLERTFESEKSKLWSLNEQVKAEYRAYVQDTERSTDLLKQNYEGLIGEYTAQLEDLRRHHEQLRKTHDTQTEQQISEIRRLSRANEEVNDICRNQAENIRVKEEKLSKLNEELRNLDFKTRTMEDSLTEMNAVKEKNKRYFELLTTSNNELNTVKIEMQGLINERNEALEKANKLEKGYIEIREELRKSIEKSERSRELVQEYQDEVKGLKEELDRSHKRLVEKEREMKSLNEEFLNQSRSTIGYKDETINRLKEDVKQVTRDYENLRREYQDIIERNEDVMLQNEKLKQIVFDKELNFNEIEKLNNLNDELLVQNEQLKNEKRLILEDAERDKRNLIKEVNTLKNRVYELQNNSYNARAK